MPISLYKNQNKALASTNYILSLVTFIVFWGYNLYLNTLGPDLDIAFLVTNKHYLVQLDGFIKAYGFYAIAAVFLVCFILFILFAAFNRFDFSFDPFVIFTAGFLISLLLGLYLCVFSLVRIRTLSYTNLSILLALFLLFINLLNFLFNTKQTVIQKHLFHYLSICSAEGYLLLIIGRTVYLALITPEPVGYIRTIFVLLVVCGLTAGLYMLFRFSTAMAALLFRSKKKAGKRV